MIDSMQTFIETRQGLDIYNTSLTHVKLATNVTKDLQRHTVSHSLHAQQKNLTIRSYLTIFLQDNIVWYLFAPYIKYSDCW